MQDDPQSGPLNPTRRTFLLTAGGTAAATVIAACVPALANSTAGQSGGLNPLYQIGGPRSIQLALKLQF